MGEANKQKNGCEILNCGYWDGEMCTVPCDCCIERPFTIKVDDPKPLKWRTGPVPPDLNGFDDDDAVLYRWCVGGKKDALGYYYGVGTFCPGGNIEDGDRIIPYDEVEYIPLSEILEQIGGE